MTHSHTDDCCQEEVVPTFVKIDEAAPDFDLPAYDPIKDDIIQVSLEKQLGKWSVLFFYPADFTFVCPTELKDLADAKAEFDAMGVDILAVSTDTVFSHRAWVQHEMLMKGFSYRMLADHTGEIAYRYNLLNEQDGTAARGTYIIDPEGVVRGIEITSGPLGRNSSELIRKIQALQFMAENPGTACPAKWVLGAKTLTPSIKISGEVGQELA